MRSKKSSKYHKLFLKGFVTGIGTAAGASIGFAILIAIASYIFNILDGMPLIGRFVAQIVKYVQEYMQNPQLK